MKKVLLGFTILYILGSCGTYKPFTSTVKAEEIKKIGILPPANVLKFIDIKENENPEITLKTKQLMYDLTVKTTDKTESLLNLAGIGHEQLQLSEEEVRIFDRELLSYVTTFSKLSKIEGSSGIPEIGNNKKNRVVFDNIIVSDDVVKIIEKNNSRYALSVVSFGTTRTPKGDATRRLKNTVGAVVATGLAAATGFGIWVKELAYVNTVYVFIFDAKEKRLAFFKSKSDVIDPLNDVLTKTQLYSCFEDYWIWYHPEAQKHLKITKK